MTRTKMALAAALMVASCATEEGLRKLADTTLGQTEAQLVGRLGPPDNVYTSDASNTGGAAKFLTWRRGSVGTAPGYVNCVGTYCFVQPATAYAVGCAITFRLEDGVVRSYRYEGNGCRA